MALETPNCAVICSGTLGQAAEHLADQRFELLILDINLPDGSGLDLLRQVRAGGDATPVILLTANDLELEEVTGPGRPGRTTTLPSPSPWRCSGPGECPTPPKRPQGLARCERGPFGL